MVCFKAFPWIDENSVGMVGFPVEIRTRPLCIRRTASHLGVMVGHSGFAYTRRSFSTVFQNVSYHTSFMRLMYSEILWPLNWRLATRRTLYQTIYVLVCFNVYLYV